MSKMSPRLPLATVHAREVHGAPSGLLLAANQDGSAVRKPPPMAPKPVSTPAPVRFDWLCEAAQQPGKAAHLALMLAWQAAQAHSPAVRPSRLQLRRFGISRDACYDGLHRLEQAHLVRVWRLPGRLPQVILVEPGTDIPLHLQ